MKKTYTLINIECNTITEKTGSIKYLIIDEAGKKRVVMAKTKLGFANRITSIKPIYYRESPLVKALSKTALNKKFHVDFTGFNQDNLRPENSSKKHRVNSLLVSQFEKSNNEEPSYFSLSISPIRILKITGVIATCVFLYHSLASVF